MMNEKLHILHWFLKRPRMYPQLIYIVTEKLFRTMDKRKNTRDEMESWCSERCVDLNTALTQLTGNTGMIPVKMLFSAYFENAERTMKSCPVKMGGPGELDLLHWSSEYLNATRVIETGVAYGWSSLAILLSLRNREDARLISTDMPYPGLNNEPYVGCIVPEELRYMWRIIKGPDRQVLSKAIRMMDQIDMCHYDSDKSYSGRMWGYHKLWKALRTGGFFISDDIGDNVAFRDFSNIVECRPIVIMDRTRYVGILIKP